MPSWDRTTLMIRQGGSLRFHYLFAIETPGANHAESKSLSLGDESADAPCVARFVACHSLIVAQVMARIMRPATEWRGRLTESIVAALIHDVGMLRVPGEILVQKDPLTIEQKREVEHHTRIGAELATRLPACPAWL